MQGNNPTGCPAAPAGWSVAAAACSPCSRGWCACRRGGAALCCWRPGGEHSEMGRGWLELGWPQASWHRDAVGATSLLPQLLSWGMWGQLLVQDTRGLSLSDPLLGAFCPQLQSQPGLPPPPRTHLCPHLPIHNLPSPHQVSSFPWGGRRCPEQINPFPEAPLHFWPLWQEHSSGAAGQCCPWWEQTCPPDAGARLCATGTRWLLPPCSSSQKLLSVEAEVFQPREFPGSRLLFNLIQGLVLSIGGAHWAKILPKSTLLMAKVSDRCACACGFPGVPTTSLFPKAGREHGPHFGTQQRSLKQHPGSGTGRDAGGAVCTELSVALFSSCSKQHSRLYRQREHQSKNADSKAQRASCSHGIA